MALSQGTAANPVNQGPFEYIVKYFGKKTPKEATATAIGWVAIETVIIGYEDDARHTPIVACGTDISPLSLPRDVARDKTIKYVNCGPGFFNDGESTSTIFCPMITGFHYGNIGASVPKGYSLSLAANISFNLFNIFARNVGGIVFATRQRDTGQVITGGSLDQNYVPQRDLEGYIVVGDGPSVGAGSGGTFGQGQPYFPNSGTEYGFVVSGWDYHLSTLHALFYCNSSVVPTLVKTG